MIMKEAVIVYYSMFGVQMTGLSEGQDASKVEQYIRNLNLKSDGVLVIFVGHLSPLLSIVSLALAHTRIALYMVRAPLSHFPRTSYPALTLILSPSVCVTVPSYSPCDPHFEFHGNLLFDHLEPLCSQFLDVLPSG